MTYLAIVTAIVYAIYVIYPARTETLVAVSAILEVLIVVLLAWVIFFR